MLQGTILPKTELNLAAVKEKIKAFIRRKVDEAQADGVVIGISGGIDSAVTAHLSVEALGSRRVLGVIMPDLRVTPKEDLQDAKGTCNELSMETKVVDIAPIHRSFMKNFEANRLAEGNLRARIRMATLYFFANSFNRVVAGTGDRSELLLGYFTKFGDGGVDILPIADLYKTEVRRLGEVLGVKRRVISKRSSPRLWAGQLAESEIGLSYDEIDEILKLRFDYRTEARTISSKLKMSISAVEKIVSRYDLSGHKRQMPEICKIR